MTKLKMTTVADLKRLYPDGQSAHKIQQAYDLAAQAHNGRIRDSGDSFIDHDLAVAHILCGLGVDVNAVLASLLHDSLLPHTGLTPEIIEQQFGVEVLSLIIGLSHLYAYTEQAQSRANEPHEESGDENGRRKKKRTEIDPHEETLETIRRAILSIIEGDIRVILIRLADCLQDLRKASGLPESERQKLATEALNIYAPLANRLGIWQLKWELEDLSFRYLEPEIYKEITSKLDMQRAKRTESIESAIRRLEMRVRETGIKAHVTGRPKHIYSIYRKMARKNLDFEHIYDVQALRVIIEPDDPAAYERLSLKEKEDLDRTQCYMVLGAVHSLWQPIPREFDDYIGAPKANGYQSLHTAVMDIRSGQTFEVQIRSRRMHNEAERGVAAHWAYKEGGSRVAASVQRRIQTLREILSALRDVDSDESPNLDLLEMEILAERIHVYTPKGDVIELPVGSTPIDFAYQIHTDIGHSCRGARIDGKMVSLDYKLKSGQRVEIITTKRGGPSRDWMNPSLEYTGRARTRSKIRQWFRNQEREQNIEQGREVVARELKRLNLSDTYTISDIAKALKYDDEIQFLAKVGFGDIQSTQIGGAIALMHNNLKPDDELRPLLGKREPKSKGLTVQGLSGMPTKLAGCCQPIPPEPIIGFITRGQGVTVHRQDCKQLENITETERLIEVDWGSEDEKFPIPIVVKAYRRPDLIEDIINLLRGQNITAPRTKTLTANSISTIYLEAEVTSLEQLNWLLQKLESLPNVVEAHRQRWT